MIVKCLLLFSCLFVVTSTTLANRNVTVRITEMTQHMTDEVAEVVSLALSKFQTSCELSQFIREQLDKKFNKYWNAAVGHDICWHGSYEKGTYIYLGCQL